MQLMKQGRLAAMAARFGRDQRASIVILLGLALVPLVGAVGLAADAARAYMVHSRLSQAVDSAALAGGRSITQSYRNDEVTKYFQGNYPAGYLKSTLAPLDIDFSDTDGTVEVVARATVPTTFLRVLSVNEIQVTARALVNRAVRGMELALVLDTTGSMAGSKIEALETAATSLLNILYGDRDTVDDFWVSVVPFAGRASFAPHSAWMQSGIGSWNGCADLRSGTAGTDDTPPANGTFPEYDPDVSGWRPPDYGCPDLPILPLTASKSTVTGVLQSMTAYGNTRTDIGMLWGWRTLSPRWRGHWSDATPTLPLDHEEPLMDKVVVLMTDGENTPDLIGDPESVAQTNTNLANHCAAMKADGIIIYTITFQAPASLDPLFSACATDPAMHFSSPSESDLQRVFQMIGAQLSNLRISE